MRQISRSAAARFETALSATNGLHARLSRKFPLKPYNDASDTIPNHNKKEGQSASLKSRLLIN